MQLRTAMCCTVENHADWSSDCCHGKGKSWTTAATAEECLDDVQTTRGRCPRLAQQTKGTPLCVASECNLSPCRDLLNHRESATVGTG